MGKMAVMEHMIPDPTDRRICETIQELLSVIADRSPHRRQFCEHIAMQLEREFFPERVEGAK